MRNLFKQSWGVALVLSAMACGSGDDTATSESPEVSGGTVAKPATAGKPASAGRGGAGATGSAGTKSSTPTTTPRGGSSATTQPAAAGHSGGAGKSAAPADEDAGMPEAGSGASGHHAAGSSGGAAAGSSGAEPKAGSGAAGSGSATAATFTEVYALFSTGCAGSACHVKATTPGGMLSMADKATAYMNLVNVDATQCRGEKRVVPSDPAKSELLASLKHTQVGSCARTPRMPDNMPQWKDSDIALVSSWIEAGAQNN